MSDIGSFHTLKPRTENEELARLTSFGLGNQDGSIWISATDTDSKRPLVGVVVYNLALKDCDILPGINSAVGVRACVPGFCLFADPRFPGGIF